MPNSLMIAIGGEVLAGSGIQDHEIPIGARGDALAVRGPGYCEDGIGVAMIGGKTMPCGTPSHGGG
jgi:hypothetical protein